MFLPVAQQPGFGLGRLAVEVSSSQTHTHPVELLRMSDQLVAEAATYAAHNKQKRRTCMSRTRLRSNMAAIRKDDVKKKLT
jgi:hypothetical protein